MGIKICPDCGGKVSETLSTCPHCGYSYSPTVRCPECYAEVSKKSPECPYCGHIFFEADHSQDIPDDVDDSDLELAEDDDTYEEYDDDEESDEDYDDDEDSEDDFDEEDESDEEETADESDENWVEVIVEREKSSACSDIETVVSVDDDDEIVTLGNGEQSSFLVKPGIRNFTISKGKNGPKFTSITEACQHYEIVAAGPVTIKFVVRTKFGSGNFIDITSIEQD